MSCHRNASRQEEVPRLHETILGFPAFPTAVPSLSWQIDRVSIENGGMEKGDFFTE
jgi:hypothetical protein